MQVFRGLRVGISSDLRLSWRWERSSGIGLGFDEVVKFGGWWCGVSVLGFFLKSLEWLLGVGMSGLDGRVGGWIEGFCQNLNYRENDVLVKI